MSTETSECIHQETVGIITMMKVTSRDRDREETSEENDMMESHTLIVDDDSILRSALGQKFNELTGTGSLLDTTTVSYRVLQLSPESTSVSGSSNSLNGQLYVIGGPESIYASNQKSIVPRTSIHQNNKPSRDDRRRATHNAVERRRRDKINCWITKLAKLVPDCNFDVSKGCDGQVTSKSSILVKACDHIVELQDSNKRLLKFLNDNESLRAELETIKSRNEQLAKENAELKALIKRNDFE